MEEIKLKAIEEKINFKKNGYYYHRVKDYGDHWYLYEIDIPECKNKEIHRYELIKAKKKLQSDGSPVYVYPSTEEFGIYGWFIFGTEEQCERLIEKHRKIE